MRRDTFIGAVVSATLLSTFLLAFNGHSRHVRRASADQSDLIRIQMPTLPPEPPEQRPQDLQDEDTTTQVAVAPPSLVDVPTIAPDATFVQEVEPPPPPGIDQAKGVVTIPAVRPSGFGRGLGKIFDISQLDQVPVPRVQQQPIYPYEMRRNGITGKVDVGFIVTTTGDVVDAYVIDSTNRAFEAPSLQAVSRWKFAPGRRGGRAVNTRMSVPIIFDINS